MNFFLFLFSFFKWIQWLMLFSLIILKALNKGLHIVGFAKLIELFIWTVKTLYSRYLDLAELLNTFCSQRVWLVGWNSLMNWMHVNRKSNVHGGSCLHFGWTCWQKWYNGSNEWAKLYASLGGSFQRSRSGEGNTVPSFDLTHILSFTEAHIDT